jgi:hypothetical protein
MDPGPDPALVYGIYTVLMALGVAAWFFGLRQRNRTFGATSPGPSRGEVEVEHAPDEVCKEIARRLASQSSGLSVRIDTCTAEEVRARLNLFPGSDATIAQHPERGGTLSCAITPSGSGSRVEWIADGRPLNRLLGVVMDLILVLGALVLVAIGLVVALLVIDHPNPAVRWQVVQTIHILHFLWPPFLFGFIARRRRALVEARVGDLLSNMKFT